MEEEDERGKVVRTTGGKCGGILPQSSGISVDQFKLTHGVLAFFLTHFHADHYVGLSDTWRGGRIYCSPITRRLILTRFAKINDALIVPLPYDTPFPITLQGRDTKSSIVTVTAMNARHCSGSIMLLFEGPFGTYLHTGDFRFRESMYSYPTLKRIQRRVDKLFIDATFCSPFWTFPTKQESIQQVLDIIEMHPQDIPVYLECEMLGHQSIIAAVAKKWNTQVSVTRKIYNSLNSIPHIQRKNILTMNTASTRFHVCKHKSFSSDLSINAQSSGALYIKPSTQWFGQTQIGRYNPAEYLDKPCKADGVWHVLHSIHSSFAELECFVKFVCPRQIVPTTDCHPDIIHKYFGPLLMSKTIDRHPSFVSDDRPLKKSRLDIAAQQQQDDVAEELDVSAQVVIHTVDQQQENPDALNASIDENEEDEEEDEEEQLLPPSATVTAALEEKYQQEKLFLALLGSFDT